MWSALDEGTLIRASPVVSCGRRRDRGTLAYTPVRMKFDNTELSTF